MRLGASFLAFGLDFLPFAIFYGLLKQVEFYKKMAVFSDLLDYKGPPLHSVFKDRREFNFFKSFYDVNKKLWVYTYKLGELWGF